jgi:glutamate/aspartate transport system permease protein
MIPDVVIKHLPYLLKGLATTLELSALALAGGIVLGMLVGLGRISRNPWVYHPVTWYVNGLRNIPLILVIFWFYFVAPVFIGHSVDPFLSAVISFVVFEATYFGEIFRAGYQTIHKETINAAKAHGMTYLQVCRYISIPIAFRRMLPSLMTQSVVTLQDTSLAYVIGLPEFVKSASIVDNMEIKSLQLYGFAAVVYFLICFAGSQIARRAELHNRKVGVA